MRTPVVIAHATEEIEPVIERMRVQGVRRLPVVDCTGLIGIVTMTDLLTALNAEITSVLALLQQPTHNERNLRR